jgi:hypothetical protein
MSDTVTCTKMADYSLENGDKILPYSIVLNEKESDLYPEDGDAQIFSYEVIGVGGEDSRYVEMSRIMFGVCKSLTQEDFTDISVIVDDEEQTLVWGANVAIATGTASADACRGLEFLFPLKVNNGIMKISFTLKNPCTVGLVDVCLYGDEITATGLRICGPVCTGSPASCETTFYQKETVCVPVHVKPYATPGTARALCCSTPVVKRGNVCSGTQNSCTFTVTQELCIAVPISFGADITTGSAVVDCGDVSETGCGCNEEPDS